MNVMGWAFLTIFWNIEIVSQCFANTCTIEYKILGVVNNLIIGSWYKCFNKHFEMRFDYWIRYEAQWSLGNNYIPLFVYKIVK